jgi:histidine ammonia-lyase
MAMGAAWKLRRVVQNVRHVLAIELICAMQGIDCRRPLRAGIGVERAYARVRELIPALEQDRPIAPDIAVVAEAIAAGQFAGRDVPSPAGVA